MPPGPGRPAGKPNRATVQAREAIAMFVDNNVDRLQGWLDAIASGKDEEGNEFGIPNPEKAANLFKDILEYHIPKLNRVEHHAEITIEHIDKVIGTLEGKLGVIDMEEIEDVEDDATES